LNDWRYSISLGHRLIDLTPMENNERPLVWNPATRQWDSGGLTFGDVMDSVPITEEEAEAFMRDGTISESARRRLDMGPYDPD
jgi:hypothetical protein